MGFGKVPDPHENVWPKLVGGLNAASVATATVFTGAAKEPPVAVRLRFLQRSAVWHEEQIDMPPPL